MIKRIILFMISSLMLLSLLIASCEQSEDTAGTIKQEDTGQKVTIGEEEEKEGEVVEEEGKEMVKDSMGRMVEKPEYGSIYTCFEAFSPQDWDEAFQPTWVSSGSRLVYQTLVEGDYSIGPTGTGEVGWRINPFPFPDYCTGILCESWEIVNETTLYFKIREGVHFQNRPPTNGREMTAEDIAYSLLRMVNSETSYNHKAYPFGREITSAIAVGKYELELTCAEGMLSRLWSGYVGTQGWTVPREAVEAYGDLREPLNTCGTGPFMVVDYIPDSSITYEKHENYWQKDPFHPENQLPYLDGVKVLIIADRSTQLAAFRTGKVEQMTSLTLEDKQYFEKTQPDIMWGKYLFNYFTIGWRVDRKPFDDIKVRKALSMAVDRQAIIDDYFQGDAELIQTICLNVPEFKMYYSSFDELTPGGQENYTYDVDRARELLEEAGYPDGFPTSVMCRSGSEAEMLQILAAYWAEIGVELELDIEESGSWNGRYYSGNYEQMVTFGHNPNRPEMLIQFTDGQPMNFSKVNDPKINAAFIESAATLLTDPERNYALVKEIIQYVIEQAYSFTPPSPYYYVAWHPWVKQYTGEVSIGSWPHFNIHTKYCWIDQDLKKSMGY
ncbi:MAG TPA: ABC transporter substrate-binding protein [Dehalococcoidia bacterium]|nr:ABC transporter substrate-binding protein [Dehalococcoidia bacterium]